MFWKNGHHTAGSVGMYLGRLACAECLSLSPGPNQHNSKIQIIRYWNTVILQLHMLTRQIQHCFTCRCCSLSFWNDSGCFSVHALRRSDSWAASSPKGPNIPHETKIWRKLQADKAVRQKTKYNGVDFLLNTSQPWFLQAILLSSFNPSTSEPQIRCYSLSGKYQVQVDVAQFNAKDPLNGWCSTHYWDTMSCKFC